MVQDQSLAWELLHAAGTAKKQKNPKNPHHSHGARTSDSFKLFSFEPSTRRESQPHKTSDHGPDWGSEVQSPPAPRFSPPGTFRLRRQLQQEPKAKTENLGHKQTRLKTRPGEEPWGPKPDREPRELSHRPARAGRQRGGCPPPPSSPARSTSANPSGSCFRLGSASKGITPGSDSLIVF